MYSIVQMDTWRTINDTNIFSALLPRRKEQGLIEQPPTKKPEHAEEGKVTSCSRKAREECDWMTATTTSAETDQWQGRVLAGREVPPGS